MSGAIDLEARAAQERERDAPTEQTARGAEYRWWEEADLTLRAQKISDVAGELWKQLEPVRSTMLMCARLYGNAPVVGLGPRSYRSTGLGGRWQRISINGVKAVCDTYVSLVTKDPPKVTVLTSGATHAVQEKAKLIEQFCDGIFYENDIHELDAQLVLDTAEFHLSVEHWYADTWTDPENPRIVCDRRLPWELLVDEATCQYGKLPREIYLVSFKDRWQLIDRLRKEYPEEAKRLETANSSHFDDAENHGYSGRSGADRLADIVPVIEAYRRPWSTQSKDGRHCIVVGDVMLNPKDQAWTRLDFPVELNWRLRPSSGVYGSPLPEELAGAQTEVNKGLAKIARSHHMCAVPHLMVEQSAKINTSQLDNQIASLIRYTGAQPVPLVYSGVAPDVYQHVWRIKDEMFSIIGVNAMNSQGQLPPGVKSGRAMRTLADVTTQRFQPSYRQFQGLYLRRFRQVIALANEISEKHPNFGTKADGTKRMKAVKWADAALREEEFILRIYATNSLADDPAERIEQVTEIQGLPAPMKRLLNFPDLDADANYEMADYNLTMRAADQIIDEGEYHGPEQFMNLDPDDPEGAIKWMNRAYLRARMDLVPEDRLNMMRTWMRQAKDLWDEAHPAPPPPMMQPGMPPPMGAPPPPAGGPMGPGAAPMPGGPPGMPVAA